MVDSLQIQGFNVFNGIFSREEVSLLRKVSNKLLPVNCPPFKSHVEGNIFDKSEELTRLILGNSRLKDAIHSVHGSKFYLLDEHALHDSFFGGWHTDTTTPESYGHSFHLSSDFLCVQWAVYLQDNSIYGGGLSVKAGTHVMPDPYVEMTVAQRNRPPTLRKLRSTASNWKKKLVKRNGGEACAYAIPTQAGDLVAFNLRIHHRATPFQIAPNDESNRKLAIFFITGDRNSSTVSYKDWIKSYHPDKKDGTREPAKPLVEFLNSEDIEFLN